MFREVMDRKLKRKVIDLCSGESSESEWEESGSTTEEEMDDKPVAAPVALPKPVVKPKTIKRPRGKASNNAWKRFDPAAFDNNFNAQINKELTTGDPTKIQATLDTYGCCIFGPVLTPRQCEKTKAAIWGAMKTKSNPMQPFDIKQPKTWRNFWTKSSGHLHGFLANHQFASNPEAWEARKAMLWPLAHTRHLSLRQGDSPQFKSLMERFKDKKMPVYDLMRQLPSGYRIHSSRDKTGFMPPVAPKYMCNEMWPHFDKGWKSSCYEDYVQAWVTFSDVAAGDPTFACYLKSHKLHNAFGKRFGLHGQDKGDHYHPKEYELQWIKDRCKLVRLVVPTGYMVMWSSKLVHTGVGAMPTVPRGVKQHANQWRTVLYGTYSILREGRTFYPVKKDKVLLRKLRDWFLEQRPTRHNTFLCRQVPVRTLHLKDKIPLLIQKYPEYVDETVVRMSGFDSLEHYTQLLADFKAKHGPDGVIPRHFCIHKLVKE